MKTKVLDDSLMVFVENGFETFHVFLEISGFFNLIS